MSPRLTRIGLGGLCLLLCAFVPGCGSPAAPTASTTAATATSTPTPTRANLSGTWRGWYQITSCASPSSCSNKQAGSTVPFVLTVHDDPASLAGPTATMQNGLAPRIDFIATLTGTVQTDGSIVFTGAEPIHAPNAISMYNPVNVRVRADIGGITGTVDYVSFVGGSSGHQTVAGAIVSASRDGEMPSPGTPAAFDPAGLWVGTIEVDTCTGLGCVEHRAGSFSLNVIAQGSGFAALFFTSVVGEATVVLNGAQTGQGTASFSGFEPAAVSSEPTTLARAVQVPKFDIRIDASSTLTGTYEYSLVGPPTSTTTVAGRLTALRRVVSFSPGSFEGEWAGRTISRSCSGSCTGYAAPGNISSISGLDLSQSGNTISGYFSFPVHGTTDGVVATISGEHFVASCPYDWEGVTCTRRLVNLTATVDNLGRMTGTIEQYQDGWAWDFFARTVKSDLWHVIRQWK
jgi:hypothetical protein